MQSSDANSAARTRMYVLCVVIPRRLEEDPEFRDFGFAFGPPE